MNVFNNELTTAALEELKKILPSGSGIVIYHPGPPGCGLHMGFDAFGMFVVAGWLELAARVNMLNTKAPEKTEATPEEATDVG